MGTSSTSGFTVKMRNASQKAMAYAILFPTAPTAAERGAMGGSCCNLQQL